MKILVDENIPKSTVESLRGMGHDVRDVRGTPEQGADDATLWRQAQAEGRLLLTTDKGFVEYRKSAHFGILVVRLRQPNRIKIHETAIRALEKFTNEEWPGMLVVARDTMLSVSRAGGPASKESGPAGAGEA
jgi:predicted nuclease of predicted toxin-antitoxin system